MGCEALGLAAARQSNRSWLPVMEAFDRCVLDRPVHALDPILGPGVVGLCRSMPDVAPPELGPGSSIDNSRLQFGMVDFTSTLAMACWFWAKSFHPAELPFRREEID